MRLVYLHFFDTIIFLHIIYVIPEVSRKLCQAVKAVTCHTTLQRFGLNFIVGPSKT